jgi:hypothetical protein
MPILPLSMFLKAVAFRNEVKRYAGTTNTCSEESERPLVFLLFVNTVYSQRSIKKSPKMSLHLLQL